MSIAILIPTHGRPDRLQGLLDNVHECTALSHTVYFIAEHADLTTRVALKTLTGQHLDIIGTFGGYPAAINAGYHASDEPFFLCVNDDVRFLDGWDTAAMVHMWGPTRCVGINQGNGRTESFCLVDRRYIREQSGVFDAENTVLHPYLSQFCDDEFADLAKMRGVWADARDAVIQHLHWTLGHSVLDENYRKAVASFEQDKATYDARRAAWLA